MTDTIPGSVGHLMEVFSEAFNNYGSHQYCYHAPTNYAYQGMDSYYWCAGFVAYQLNQVGFDLRKVVSAWAYCPAVEQYMHLSEDWITTAYQNAQAGDIILFKRNGVAYHIGIASGPYNHATGILPTHEGDTSNPAIAPGSDSTGGCYAYKSRYMPNYGSGAYTVHIFRHKYLGGTVAASATSAGSAAAVSSVLQVGSTGVQVAHLQAALNKVFPSYTDGGLSVDGSLGPKTAAAVQKFQAACHIAADGVVGATTLSYLAHYGIKL